MDSQWVNKTERGGVRGFDGTSAFAAELLEAASACVRELNECREREGRELTLIISRELDEIENATGKF
jgi:uncharacterized protein YicC (UPF0701 family)